VFGSPLAVGEVHCRLPSATVRPGGCFQGVDSQDPAPVFGHASTVVALFSAIESAATTGLRCGLPGVERGLKGWGAADTHHLAPVGGPSDS